MGNGRSFGRRSKMNTKEPENNKRAGLNGIIAEIIKQGRETLFARLYEL